MVPSIEDKTGDSSVCISEAPAILAYLSSKHCWADIYPSDIAARAKVDEYCHWHHSNLRSITKAYFRVFTIPHPLITPDVINLYKKQANTSLKIIENTYLKSSSSGFLLGTDYPTAADFMAYEEAAQISPQFGNIHNLEEFPRVRAWLENMSLLPFHDEVHAGLRALGNLTSADPLIADRLRSASKIGVKAIVEAQKQCRVASKL